MSQPDSLSLTLLFKKHKTTVLLMLPPTTTITTAKELLLGSLQSRGLQGINGDVIPGDASEIEFGVPVDKNDLEKGWTSLEPDVPQELLTKSAGRKSAVGQGTLQAAELKNGQSIAFRFRKRGGEDTQDDTVDDLEDPGWDVILPKYEEEEEEEELS
ncbi:hypothetical protein P168DRAFT_280758 [Aspergillus campestris IBT 28561]|uniref:Uncharacterized protein n=1 Tax=Aspergillus campestris (strain IBT 28561) TaxID=1392248 RepID=A0A2I1D7N7_ASPC2|nr:uncharacterized protein P168DRAFT_280758 [Aspergillus campestris IBT 28561]PKY05889.1 hypothetical protein P168DRAFT_280758 [Aspergillus campestris IBT 28561]